jgi:hypothetical protein
MVNELCFRNVVIAVLHVFFVGVLLLAFVIYKYRSENRKTVEGSFFKY